MGQPEESAAKRTLKIAGVFQELTETWSNRLNAYFSQIDSLVDGEWLDSSDLKGILREAREASNEALNGLGRDLSAELIQRSAGVFSRHENERAAMIEEMDNLKAQLDQALSADTSKLIQENNSLKQALLKVPEYQVLSALENQKEATYKELGEACDIGTRKTRPLVRTLAKWGSASIDKDTRPHRIFFRSAPWGDDTSESFQPSQEFVKSSRKKELAIEISEI
ncbi:MAG: hypothetical protein ACOC3C_06235 [Candidatus Thorarchaeota archaeon]